MLVSIASLWEIAVKSALGKLDAPDDLPQRLEELGFELLGITVEHAWAVRNLPHHHGEPTSSSTWGLPTSKTTARRPTRDTAP